MITPLTLTLSPENHGGEGTCSEVPYTLTRKTSRTAPCRALICCNKPDC